MPACAFAWGLVAGVVVRGAPLPADSPALAELVRPRWNPLALMAAAAGGASDEDLDGCCDPKSAAGRDGLVQEQVQQQQRRQGQPQGGEDAGGSAAPAAPPGPVAVALGWDHELCVDTAGRVSVRWGRAAGAGRWDAGEQSVGRAQPGCRAAGMRSRLDK